ncbi:MAG: class I SAM-dependent methyltransferase [Candidatus Gastranaerophilaceae bacterium]
MQIEFVQDIIDILRGKKVLKLESKNNIVSTNNQFDKNKDADLKKIEDLIQSGQKIKLNLGCGEDYKEGWQNIDNNYYGTHLKLDFEWDLSKPMLFPDNSVDYIFNEHFLEHLTYDEGFRFLTECKRVLKDSGTIRIAMPDLETCINNYLNPPSKEQIIESLYEDVIREDWSEEIKNAIIERYANPKTRAQSINIAFREEDGSHKWLYDFEEIKRLATEVGFTQIKRYNAEESDTDELRNLECRKNGSTLVVEVRK